MTGTLQGPYDQSNASDIPSDLASAGVVKDSLVVPVRIEGQVFIFVSNDT